jgi:hypothetical protein
MACVSEQFVREMIRYWMIPLRIANGQLAWHFAGFFRVILVYGLLMTTGTVVYADLKME